jgi:hypothetical protein
MMMMMMMMIASEQGPKKVWNFLYEIFHHQ